MCSWQILFSMLKNTIAEACPIIFFALCLPLSTVAAAQWFPTDVQELMESHELALRIEKKRELDNSSEESTDGNILEMRESTLVVKPTFCSMLAMRNMHAHDWITSKTGNASWSLSFLLVIYFLVAIQFALRVAVVAAVAVLFLLFVLFCCCG